jgi:ribulose-5-phosphate 4-epimerase/fuculose-1-phosphate aldolase
MNKLERAKRDLVIANRVLAMEGVVDAYGHIAARHPDNPNRYLLSRSLAPELVTPADIIEFELDGTPIGDKRAPYLERYIHGAIFEKRPDAIVSLHAHTESTLPFSITGTPMKPVFHSASEMGTTIPTWDIDEKFGDHTNLLVTNMDQGRHLAERLAKNTFCLMRGHGFAGAGTSISRMVTTSIYFAKNARILLQCLTIGGGLKTLHAGEIEERAKMDPNGTALRRGWEFWARKAGVGELLED